MHSCPVDGLPEKEGGEGGKVGEGGEDGGQDRPLAWLRCLHNHAGATLWPHLTGN